MSGTAKLPELCFICPDTTAVVILHPGGEATQLACLP